MALLKKKTKPNQTVFKIHTQEKRVATYTSTDLKVVFDNGTWNYLHAAFAVVYIEIFCSFFGGMEKKNKDMAKTQPNRGAAVKPNNKSQVWEGRRESDRKGPDVALGPCRRPPLPIQMPCRSDVSNHSLNHQRP